MHLKSVTLACMLGAAVAATSSAQTTDTYTQRFLDLRAKIYDPANGYFSADGVPYHSVESLICEAPDHGHETTSEAYSYWIWLDVMYGRVSGNWTPLNNAWTKMEATAIPTTDLQPTAGSYNPNAPATYAGEFAQPSGYPAPLDSSVPVGRDPVSPELTAAYGANVYGMHWLFDCDNFYGYGNKGTGTGTPSYINTFQRGEQESVWETVPHPSWENFRWGATDGTGFLKLFVAEAGAPAAQWRYTNAPDADARAVQAIYWGIEFAKAQGLNPTSTLPVAKASKMGDFLRLSMFDKYFRPLGVQNRTSPGGTGYDSAHYLLSWYYAWGGPLVSQGWAWRIGCSHNHFGYQNPVAAHALSATTELRPISTNGARDWATSLTRQLEFYQWLQSAEGAIAGGATNSWNGRYETYPSGTPTFYGMGYDDNPVYHDPGSNTWFGFQAWSMERVAELYYINNHARAKAVMDKWVAWAKTVVRLNADGTFDIPSEIAWSGAPATWNPTSPATNSNLHVSVVSYGKDLGIAAALAKTLTYYAAATQRYGTLDTAARDLAKEILDRMWTKYYEPTGKGVAVVESRGDFKRFFEQEIYIPSGWTGRMANGDPIGAGVSFIDIRSKYLNDPDYPALAQAYANGTDYQKAYHRFWAQVEIALANAEYGRFFAGGTSNTLSVSPTSVALAATASSGTFAVSSNIAWTVTDNQTWLTVSPASGSNNATVTVSATANTATTARTATVTVAGSGLTQTVTVTQAGATANTLTVSPTSLALAAAASSGTFAITSNVTWTVTDNQTWITVSPTSGSNNGTVTVSATANTATTARTGTVTVTGGGITQTVAISQAGATANTLTVSPTSLSLAAAASSGTFNVASNVTWTVTDNQTWITVSPASGSNNGTVTVSATANTATTARTGTVTVTGGGITQTVAISQAGTVASTLTVTPTSLSLAAAASSGTFSISSNVSWTTTDDQSWLSVTPASGTNNATATVSATANTATTARTGTVTITGGGLTRTVAVTQAGSTTTTPCTSPTTISLPFSQDGAGTFCFFTTGTIAFVNSWNLQTLEINGVSFTNQWSNSMPPRLNGGYYIRYVGNFPWSHFEASGSN